MRLQAAASLGAARWLPASVATVAMLGAASLLSPWLAGSCCCRGDDVGSVKVGAIEVNPIKIIDVDTVSGEAEADTARPYVPVHAAAVLV